jgi:hypothetical protein
VLGRPWFKGHRQVKMAMVDAWHWQKHNGVTLRDNDLRARLIEVSPYYTLNDDKKAHP